MSPELQRNLGEVLALLPLPSVDSEVVSVERGGSSYNVVVRLMGETDEVELQTRWKDRDGEPTLVEVSHLSSTERVAAAAEKRGGRARGRRGLTVDDHLSTEQVGWVVGRSPGTVRDKIKDGEIEATRIVDGYRIPKAEVLRLARERIEAEAGRKLSDRDLERLIDEVIATNEASLA